MDLLTHLEEGMRAAILAGDFEAARVAHQAIGQLLGSAPTAATPSEQPAAKGKGGRR